ncbi:NADH dehydrogenase [ubiquinone] iron-sulfur protein 6, mitochondrial-like [Ptychodera flava]|uniref:NADH dehydrogenase [ubiquinone] iron-sulfur protein 6, mitochondrial-like n=1 Tax=Ptychodera flava TaxID=63121 RepID=UPI003969F5AA
MAALRLLSNRVPTISRQIQNIARPISTCHRCFLEDKQVTHTGQVFDEGDYRVVRFTQAQKEVNEKFAIDLIDDIPPIVVDGNHVWCDGGGGALGHPKVYINLDQEGPHACGYCGLRYIKKKH